MGCIEPPFPITSRDVEGQIFELEQLALACRNTARANDTKAEAFERAVMMLRVWLAKKQPRQPEPEASDD